MRKEIFQMKTSVQAIDANKMLIMMYKDFIEPGFTEHSTENEKS